MLSRLRGDDGLTLIEVVIAMTISAVFLSIFTGAVIQIYRTLGTTQSVTTNQLALATVYERLDAEIRYASAISTPGLAGQDPVVEYLNTNGVKRVCTQLRFDSGSLQRRTWTQGTTPGTGWGTLASELTADTPFTLIGSATAAEQLQVRLTAHSGPQSQESTFLFTATNSVISDANATICAEGR